MEISDIKFNIEKILDDTSSDDEFKTKAQSELENLKNRYPDLIKEVRGRGLMLALVMQNLPNELITKLRQNGLLVVGASGNAIRFLPPLTICNSELKEALEITKNSLKEFHHELQK